MYKKITSVTVMLFFLFSIGTTLIMADEADDDKTTSSETVTEQIESDATQETSDEMQETTETEKVIEDVNQTKESEKRDEQFETEEPENSNTEKPSKVINMKRTSSAFDDPIFKNRTLKSDTSYHLLFVGEEKVFLTDSEQKLFSKMLKRRTSEWITVDDVATLLKWVIINAPKNKIEEFVEKKTLFATKYFEWENWQQDEVNFEELTFTLKTKTTIDKHTGDDSLYLTDPDDNPPRDYRWKYVNDLEIDANKLELGDMPIPLFYIDSFNYYLFNYGKVVHGYFPNRSRPKRVGYAFRGIERWFTINKHDLGELASNARNSTFGAIFKVDESTGEITMHATPESPLKQMANNLQGKIVRNGEIYFTADENDSELQELLKKYARLADESSNDVIVTEEDAVKLYNNQVSVPLPLTSVQMGVIIPKLVKAVHVDENGERIEGIPDDVVGNKNGMYGDDKGNFSDGKKNISISKKDIDNYRFKSYDVYQDGELISQDNTNDKWTNPFIPDKKTGLVFHYQRVYKVDFESNGGTQVESQVVEKNGKVQEPEEPTRYNQMFDGWYKDKELTKKYNFQKETVDGDIILYAKWVTPIVDPQDGVTPIKPIDKISDIDQDNSLLIKYVSEFDFGTHENTVLKGIEGKAKADKIEYLDGDKKNEIVDSPLFVSIVDNREDRSRGWELQVKATPFKTASNTILKNAKIQLTGLKYADTEKAMPEISQDGSITLSEESQTISSTKGNIEGETWSLSLGGLDNTEDAEANSTGVSIVIPKGSIKKNEQYNATIEWELTPPIL